MSNMAIYLVGLSILVLGLGVGAHLLGVPPMWIGVGALICIGIGVLASVGKARQKSRPPE